MMDINVIMAVQGISDVGIRIVMDMECLIVIDGITLMMPAG